MKLDELRILLNNARGLLEFFNENNNLVSYSDKGKTLRSLRGAP